MGKKQNTQCQILGMFYFLKKQKEAHKEAPSELKTSHNEPQGCCTRGRLG